MNKRIKLLLLLISVSFTLSLMSNTYSKYIAGTDGKIESNFASWQILVNESDVLSNSNSTVKFIPIIQDNANVADNVLAPSSVGYFDIDIDPTNIKLSFRYTIGLSIGDTELSDLIITQYEILDETKISNPLNLVDINNNAIENTMLFNNNIDGYKHEKFTIRVYFEWYEGADETSDDISDTDIKNRVLSDEIKLLINASLKFEQLI